MIVSDKVHLNKKAVTNLIQISTASYGKINVPCESRIVGKLFNISGNEKGKCSTMSYFAFYRDISSMYVDNIFGNRKS